MKDETKTKIEVASNKLTDACDNKGEACEYSFRTKVVPADLVEEVMEILESIIGDL